MKVGIAGGGLVGRLLAWRAARAGATVELFDAGAHNRCSEVAAGMLSPAAELASGDATIATLGFGSLPLWTQWLTELEASKLLVQRGSLLVAHGRDRAELDRVAKTIAMQLPDAKDHIVPLDQKALQSLEPALAHLPCAYYLPTEGHLDVTGLLPCLRTAGTAAGVAWHDDVTIDTVEPGVLTVAGTRVQYDWTCDCRGLGTADLPLRAVRGEIIHLASTEVCLQRPVRLIHPRYPVYIVPRAPDRLLVGATEIESSDNSEITVRSALELLGAVYSLIPALAEARIVACQVGLRPALPDNIPKLATEPGRICINGMYRHGFLAAPALINQAATAMGLGELN